MNDFYGHDCGDSVLMSITENIRKSIRICDTIGRRRVFTLVAGN
ncbi:diguanylate cyclase [Oceanispirochaeta crateris]|uniref:Diguanylate cyclase n=1 Tax=Oceanispirochaeta crateris TaxID=2518645 RepID=A0A5C1QTD5_9SPIO|nr:diguanylate cyclase [Oceanispirochaeta crateris]